MQILIETISESFQTEDCGNELHPDQPISIFQKQHKKVWKYFDIQQHMNVQRHLIHCSDLKNIELSSLQLLLQMARHVTKAYQRMFANNTPQLSIEIVYTN